MQNLLPKGYLRKQQTDGRSLLLKSASLLSPVLQQRSQARIVWSLLIGLLILATGPATIAQTTTISTESGTAFTGGNGVSGSSAVTFVVENTNAYDITLTGVDVYWQTTNTGTTPTLWYSATSLSGLATIASPAWTSIVTAPAQTIASNGYYNTFTNLSFTIPSGTQYRFAVQSTNGIRYSGTAGPPSPNTFSSAGVNLKVYDAQINGANVGQGGSFPSPANNPRAFTGRIHFQAATPCTNPVTAGTATTTATGMCPGSNFTLSLTGASGGTGTTVQWQSSPTGAAGSFTNIPGATTLSYTTSQTTTTYYQAVVTCSGGTPATSTVVQVTSLPGLPGGVYTIEAGNPAADYQSFAEVVADLSCGITGPVTFNVVAGSGPYNEQVTIPQVGGASATNRVTFNGNGATLSFNATVSAARHTILLDGADYITINNLNIVAANSGSTTTSYGWGIHLFNDADFNEITNNTITVNSTSTSASVAAGIVASGSATVTTTDGQADNNLISGNTINGGYVGIILTGNGTALSANNQVLNNTVLNYYANGIDLEHQSNALVSTNDISRPTRATTGTHAGITLSGNSQGSLIEKNRVHNTHDAMTTSTSTSYGIYFTANDASATTPNQVINNLLYNLNGDGIIYAIYNTSSDNAQYYHNTISLDETGSTATAVTRGFYQTTTATGIDIKNNIISITRGGTGVKTALYFNTAGSTITSNYNVLYVNSGSGTDQIGSIGTTGYATLAAWQGQGYDLQSYDLNPLFANPGSGNFMPGNPLINDSGTPLGVTTDILGVTRSLTQPDPGAYAFTVPPCSGTPVAGTATPSVTTVCAGTDFTIALSGFTIATGITFQWQSSPTGVAGSFTDLPGDTVPTFTGSQLASTFYRVAVTCNGTTTAYSNVVQVTSPALFPAGIYTIGQGNPTADYQNFTQAVNAILCGIAGPVTFNVMAGTGPYNEQVIIPQIFGAGAASRITFNGNGEVLTFNTADANNRSVIRLDGADYVTFDGLTINATGTTYGWGIHLANDADFNELLNNTITITSTSTTAANTVGIGASGSYTLLTTGGQADNNTILGNTINGGYSAIVMTGDDTNTGDNNQIINNIFTDYYSYGIDLDDQASITVSGNDMSRPTRATVTTHYGIYLSGATSANNLFEGNSIHNTNGGSATSTSALYGIYITGADATAAQPNLVINNLIYDFNGNGLIYALYNGGADNARYYHNTISLDHTASAATGVTRGFYQITAATGIDFRNNIVSITRGGTGAKHAVYFGTATSDITSNHNVLYVNAAAGTNEIGFSGAGQATLTDWQALGFDQQSVAANPQFTNAAAGNFLPTSTVIDNIGTPVGVLTDITGAPRSTIIPDPGAYEFNIPVPCPAPVGITVSNITCVEALVNWVVADTVGEFNLHVGPVGFDPLDPLTGGTSYLGLMSAPYNLQFLTQGDTFQIYLEQYCYAAGTSTMSGPVTFITETCEPGVISGQNSFCYSGTPTLSLGNTGAGFTIQWQDSVAGGAFTNIPGADTLTYTPAAPLTQTTYYRAITNGGSGNMTSNVFAVVISSPLITATNSPVGICAPGQVTLSATASEGDVKWFDAATDGTLLHTGSTYTTSVTSNTTFYAEASTGAGSVTVGPLNPGPPLGTPANFSALVQFAEFSVLAATATISSVDIFPTAAIGSPFTIVIQNSATNVIYSYSGVTTVQNSVSGPYTPQTVVLNAVIPQGTGYRAGFSVNPGMIRNGSGAVYPYAAPGVFSVTGNTFNTAYYYFFYNIQIQSGCASPRIPVSVNIDPVLPFTVSGDTIICTGSSTTLSIASPQAGVDYTWSSAAGTLTGNSITVSPTDSVVYTITGNNATGCTASAMVSVAVNPIPVATASANSPLFMGETLSLSASGGASYNWSGPNGFASNLQNPELSNVGTAATGTYTVVVTSNQCSDTATVNVTVVDPTTPLSGTYTINQNAPASPINFTSFTSAATFLNTAGVAGPVTINVVSGTSPYLDQQFLLGNIPGTSSANTVTINGNGETLSFCATSPGNRDIVRLDGTDWLRLNNLNIIGTCSQGWGIHLLNGADNVILDGNTVTVNATSPNLSMNQGIVATNSFVDPQALGTAATNLQVLNNTVNGGYNGIRINGAEAAPSTGLVLNNNTVNNAYEYGIYVLYNNAPQIINNDVTMRAGNVRSMGYMINRIEQGITFTGNYVKNAGRRSIFLNYVNHTSTTTGLIANNMVAGGLQNQTEADGLYINYSDHLQVYHNSTVTDNSGTGYSFCVTNWGSRYIDVKNNSFAYTGNGNGYAVAVGASIMDYQQDYNNYYSNGANLGRMGNVNHPNTPAGWVSLKGAPNQWGAHDLNSMNVNPMYITNLDLKLQAGSPLINTVTPLVATDFYGTARQATTDMGAYETGTNPRVTAGQGLEATVYPNPFREELKVELSGVEGKVAVVLSDMMGREVYRNSYQVTEAGFTVRPATEIAEGVYMLQITANGITTQYRVVKQ